jgi:hypothetical protein
MKRLPIRFSCALAALSFPVQAYADTNTYTYDALGRLVKVEVSGGPQNNVAASYSFDAADNRTNVTITGSQNSNGDNNGGAAATVRRMIATPLPGYFLLFIPN